VFYTYMERFRSLGERMRSHRHEATPEPVLQP
jgi:hypothetical protein